MKSNEEKVYVYYLKTTNELFFVKDRDFESFVFECKKHFNMGDFKSFGMFTINYIDGQKENTTIGKVIKLIYNRGSFKRCGVFIPTIVTKKKGITVVSTGSRPYTNAELGSKGLDSGEPSKVEHNHVINPPV
jgi:hypothetical protein